VKVGWHFWAEGKLVSVPCLGLKGHLDQEVAKVDVSRDVIGIVSSPDPPENGCGIFFGSRLERVVDPLEGGLLQFEFRVLSLGRLRVCLLEGCVVKTLGSPGDACRAFWAVAAALDGRRFSRLGHHPTGKPVQVLSKTAVDGDGIRRGRDGRRRGREAAHLGLAPATNLARRGDLGLLPCPRDIGRRRARV